MCLSANSNTYFTFLLDIGDSCLEALHSVGGNNLFAQTHTGVIFIALDLLIVIQQIDRILASSLFRVKLVSKHKFVWAD